MSDNEVCLLKSRTRTPWNKGKLIDQNSPDDRAPNADLAMFNLAIDSKLRGCDAVALEVEDIAPGGYTIDRATVRQRKTGRPVKFELTDPTREAVDDYLRAAAKKPGEFLFTDCGRSGQGMTTRQYARLVSRWVASIGLDAASQRH